jgi:hypothetical protein
MFATVERPSYLQATGVAEIRPLQSTYASALTAAAADAHNAAFGHGAYIEQFIDLFR